MPSLLDIPEDTGVLDALGDLYRRVTGGTPTMPAGPADFPYEANPVGTSTTRPQYASDATNQPFDPVVGSGQLPVTRGLLADMAESAWKTAGAVSDGGIGTPAGLLGAIKVYHGSPHLFEPTPKNPLGEFRLDKIGTGEGNQAFGQGMYVAEAERVAREGYRDKLTRTDMPLYQGKPIGRGDEAYDVGSWMNERLKPGEAMEDYLWRRATSLEDQGKYLRRGNDPQNKALGEFYLEAAKKLKAQNPADWSFPTGHMYEVNLNAEPHEFLHWDKKYSQQSPEVQAKLADAYRARGMPLDADGNPLHFQRDPTGESMHASLSGAEGQELGAEVLRNAGIPGVRYLDRSSRGRDPNAADVTHNYAVFDPEKMEIIRRYGIAGLITGGGAAAAAGGNQEQSQ